MAMKKTYYTVDGEILGEKAAGGQRVDYLTDALGNVTATVNASGQVVNTYKYKPYGAQLSRSGLGSDPSFQWVGSQGYRQTGKKYSDVYVRARHYETLNGRWATKDLIGFDGGDWNLYRYTANDPVLSMDASGLYTQESSPCGIRKAWWVCTETSDRTSIAANFQTNTRIDPCNSFKACDQTKPCPGETCVAINGGFYDLKGGTPIGPAKDCHGHTGGIIPKPSPGFTTLSFTNGMISGYQLFNSDGTCKETNVPSGGSPTARTAACVFANKTCFLIVPGSENGGPGMTAKQLCACMKEKCKGGTAANLDGGGSTQYYHMSDDLVCHYTVRGGPRPVSNWIVLCNKSK